MKLGTAVRLVGGSGFPHELQGGKTGTPFFKVSDLQTSDTSWVVNHAANSVSTSALVQLGATVVPPGSILMPKIGAAIQSAQRRVRIGVPAAFDNNVLALVPERVNERFLQYWVWHLDLRPLSQPGAVPSLDMVAFRALPLPDLKPREQREVVEFLDRQRQRIDEVIAGLIAQLDGAESYRQAVVVTAACELRSRPLKYGFQVIDCKHRTPDYRSAGYPVISTREVKRGALVLATVDRFVDEDDYRDLREGGRGPRSGDIIYSRNASVGVAAYVDAPVEVCLGQDVVLITRRPRDSALLAYVLNFAVEEQVARLSVGSTFSRINVPTIRSLVVPDDEAAAEVAAVREIEESFRPLAQAEHAIRAMIVTLREYRDALITEAVTGKLDVTKLSEQQLDESTYAAIEGERPEVLSA